MKKENTSNSAFRPIRWTLCVLLFGVAAAGMMCVFGILHLFTSFVGWLIVPSGLIYGTALLISLVLFSVLYLLGRRKRWAWLKALALGGASVPVLMAALILIGPLVLPKLDPAQVQEPNQREPGTSPSGRYVLTVPIERSKVQKGPLGFGMPYWHVTISDPNGKVVYRDVEDKFAGIRNVYWTWGDGDIAWLYDSDDGSVYYYQCANGQWTRNRWGSGKTGYAEQGIAPPVSLYPSYVSAGPVQNLGSPWQPCGFSRSTDPNGPAWITFSNIETHQQMMLQQGESRNGVTLLNVDWEKREVVVEIKGKQSTLSLDSGR